MKWNNVILSLMFIILVIFIAGCISNNSYSVTLLQDYDSSLCSSSGIINGGYDYIGLRLQAYDSESGEIIHVKSTYFSFPEQNGGSGGSSGESFSCYMTDPTFPISVSVDADGYIPIQNMNIGSVPVGKMYLVKVAMQRKPSCYFDENNLDQYYEYIERGFGLTSNQYTLKCMDSDFTRGGFVEAQGSYATGGNFELLYHWGWCSSSGAGCGSTICFGVEGNDELFETVKNKLCNEIQKCLDGEYEYTIGNKKVISIVSSLGRYSSSVEKGSSDCLSIY